MKRAQLITLSVSILFIIFIFYMNMNMHPDPSPASAGSPASGSGLSEDQKYILEKKGTEAPFSNPLYHEKRPGTYLAADTKEPVFRSEQKYESGTGWPSFWAPISPDAVKTVSDESHGMIRTEVMSRAGGHLGHVFTDGPEPTGLRYCINGDALIFVPDEEK